MSLVNESTLSERIVDAVIQNDVAQLKQLRKAGENFASRDENNNTLLHLAILSKSERELCDSDRKLNKNYLRRTEVFSYLLTLNEINKDAKNNELNTALLDIFMYLRDSPDWAIELIKSGCDIHSKFRDGSTALHWAVSNDWDQVVELLIENGFEIDCRNYDGATPLHLACKLGFIDLVWMLLFYGADVNKGNCFDLIFKDSTTYEVRIILESLVGYENVVDLLTFVNVIKQSPEIFYKLCHLSKSIKYTEAELSAFCTRLLTSNPQLFKIFIQKYGYVIHDMFNTCWLAIFTGPINDKNELENFTANILTIFESDVVEDIVSACNEYPRDTSRTITTCFHDHNELDLLTQLIFCMLSHGVIVTTDLLDRIYYKFGYCSLFKKLFHIEMRTSCAQLFVPRFFYDISLTPEQLIRSIEWCNRVQVYYYTKNLPLILDYFALPKLVKCCLDTRLEDMDEMERLVKQAERLPDVPKLLELARNKAREFIIYKYEIRSWRQFHTIINWLPIAKIHKEILTYERKLYE